MPNFFRKTLVVAAALLVIEAGLNGVGVSIVRSALAAADTRLDVLDPVFYLNTYPDLKAAFGTDTGAAQNHWITYGIQEGRQSSAAFSVKDYLARYPDLINAFGGTNYRAALDHWLAYGKKEGRNPGPAAAAAPVVTPVAPAPAAPVLRRAPSISIVDGDNQRGGMVAAPGVAPGRNFMPLKVRLSAGYNGQQLSRSITFSAWTPNTVAGCFILAAPAACCTAAAPSGSAAVTVASNANGEASVPGVRLYGYTTASAHATGTGCQITATVRTDPGEEPGNRTYFNLVLDGH